jgi:cysteine sulfinate desulfinase/cysteine desulfurase-like protein
MQDAKIIDWYRLRRDFPILDQQVHGKPLIYLDNAATSQKPRAVIEALTHYYERDNANVHRGIHELSNRATNGFEAARARTATFINAASADEIVFTRGTTEGINLVAATWGLKNLKAGDVILLTELEHHSNLVPWQLLAQRTGAKIAYVPVTGDEGTLDLSRIDALLAPPVKFFSMVHISNSMGTVNPVAELCARARKRGIITLVDGAQSAGHLPVDVQAMGLGLDAKILRGVQEAGYTEPTPIQTAAIPPIIAGQDLIGIAQTGTGKTAAFTLPILTKLAAQPPGQRRGTRVLVIAPTRELVVQIEENVRAYAKHLPLTVATVFGGVGEQPQIRALRSGTDVIIACPGRLLDLMGQRCADFTQLKFLVLDEADRMLDMGFLPDIRKIVQQSLPKQRQTLMFSATLSKEIESLTHEFQRAPKIMQIGRRSNPAETVTQLRL